MNLVEALLKANEESRAFLRELDECEQLAPGPGLAVSRAFTNALIDQTEVAIASGDVLTMLAAARANGIGDAADAAAPSRED